MQVKRSKWILLIAAAVLVAALVGFAGGVVVQRYDLSRRLLDRICHVFADNVPQVIARVAGDKSLVLKTRTFAAAIDPSRQDDESDSEYVFHDRTLDLDKTALILIDVWAYHPNDGWLARAQRHMAAKIEPLLALARAHSMIIIHAAHGRQIATEAGPLPGEIVLDGAHAETSACSDYLKANGIENLIYAGYSSNWCVLYRPVGLANMAPRGYHTILVRDCTISSESPETLPGEWGNKVAINMVEYLWGETTTLDDLRNAFSVQE